MQAIA
jgi:hypothetical protein